MSLEHVEYKQKEVRHKESMIFKGDVAKIGCFGHIMQTENVTLLREMIL
jgi:hypothetical protein